MSLKAERSAISRKHGGQFEAPLIDFEFNKLDTAILSSLSLQISCHMLSCFIYLPLSKSNDIGIQEFIGEGFSASTQID